MALIRESRVDGDLGKWSRRRGKLATDKVELSLAYILADRAAEMHAKNARQVHRMNARSRGELT